MPLVLWLRGGEGRGEDGEKVKRKKLHSPTINVYFSPLSSSSPPILSHFCCHSPSISITSFLASPPSPSLHPPSLLIRISCLHRFFWSYSAPTPFIFRCQPLFFFTILIISKEFLPPRYAFSYLISVCTHLPEHIFFVGAFFQVNFSSSTVNRSAFICTHM